ncbi:Lysosome-associated membrane glycoprotein 1 [Eufriesea mexicana]|nr:Lysosome-associated membrane glycoprotein 1 [Eufriesea mexicana]
MNAIKLNRGSRGTSLYSMIVLRILGENQADILSRNRDALPNNATSSQNDSEPHLKTTTLPSKIVSLEPESVSTETYRNKLKPQEILSNDSSIQSSTVVPNNSTDVPSDTTAALINTNETTTEQVLHPTTNPTVIRAPTNTVSRASGKWIVVNESDQICIIVQMYAVFTINYTLDNHTISSKTFDIPADNVTTNATGHCGTSEQYLTLVWSPVNVTDANLTLHFTKNISENYYTFHHLEIVIPEKNFNKSLKTSVTLVHEMPNMEIKTSNSYKCLKQQKLDLKQEDSNRTSGSFSLFICTRQCHKYSVHTILARDCAFDTPDVVPIAVGCALGGLVIIVLIAYLIGRRLNQSQGYLSM